MVKPGAKKKRTKEEMREAAKIEAQLKSDKNAFRNEMQKMESKAKQQDQNLQVIDQERQE